MSSPASLTPPLERFEGAYADFNFYAETNREEAKAIFINELRPFYKEIIPSRSLLSRVCTCIFPPPQDSEELQTVRARFQLANEAFRAPQEGVPPPPPVPGSGFRNPGANCWCNALLQMIFHNPLLRNAYLEFADHLAANGCVDVIATGNRQRMARAQAAYTQKYNAHMGSYPLSSIIDRIIPPPPRPQVPPQIDEDLENSLEEEDPLYDLLRTLWKTIRAAFASLFCCFHATPPEEEAPVGPLSLAETQRLEALKERFQTAIQNAYNALLEAEAPPAEGAKASTLRNALNTRLDAALRTAWAEIQNDEVFLTLSQTQKSAILYPVAYRNANQFARNWIWIHRNIFIGPPPPPPPAPAEIQAQAREHGVRLRQAFDLYEQHRLAGTPVPEEVSQNVRLAFAFLLVNNNPPLSPLSSHQEDASEVLAHWIALYAFHLGHPIPFATPQKETRRFAKTDEPLFPEPPPPLTLPPIPSFEVNDIPITEGWTPSAPRPDLPSSEDTLASSIAEWKDAAQSQKAVVRDINPNEQPSSKKKKALEKSRTEWLKTMSAAEKEVTSWEKRTRTLEERRQIHERKTAAEADEATKYTVLGNGFTSSSNSEPHATIPIEIKHGIPPRLQDLFLSTLVEFPTEDSELPIYQYGDGHFLFKELLTLRTFENIPPNLLIPIKRQRQNDEGQTIKDTTPISVPGTLVLPKEHIENPPKEDVEYRLQAFIKHTGANTSSGHYIAYWKDPETNRWVEANDARTSWISERRALRVASEAYVLLYDPVMH